MAYSKDFRQKVLSTREQRGLSLLETAELFGVGVASVFRWTKKPEPCKTRDKPATKIDMDALARDVADAPDDFHYERALRLGVSGSCVGRALARLKMSRKKALAHPKACEEKRKAFRDKMEGYEKERKNIIYLDEGGFENEALRHYGYAKIGARCVGTFDWQAKARTNVIGAVLGGVLLGVGLFECNANADEKRGRHGQCLFP